MTPRIFTTVFPHAGRGSLAANDEREKIAGLILGLAKRHGAKLVLFPSGLLRAPSERDLKKTARNVLEMSAQHGVPVIFGVDVDELWSKRPAADVGVQRLPMFVVSQSAEDAPRYWRQRSITSAGGDALPDAALKERRFLRVGKTEIDVLACGEVFNKRLRKLVVKSSILVVPTHTAHGARFSHAVNWSRTVPVRAILRATHAGSATVGSQTRFVENVEGVVVRRWG